MPRVMADLYIKFSCTYCQEDISGLHIKCVECSEFELCLQCFAAGAEIGQHKNDHSYQFVGSWAIGWTAREELQLLDAVEAYGFGNWEDISRHIESKTPEEAREHFISVYLEGVIGRLTWTPALALRPNLAPAATADSGPLSPSSSGRLPPLDVTAEEAKDLGYMPLRDDFDPDYDNDAETLLSPLSVNDGDDELDTALTLVQVDIYTHRLRERARRKRVVRDYQLVSQFFNANTKKERKKVSKDEKEFQDGMRVFCQFHTAQEHEQFLHNMQREQELKVRLSELARYRRFGITRHEECSHFEQELLYQQELVKDKTAAEGSEKLVSCSNERRSALSSLGSQWLDKLSMAGVTSSGDYDFRPTQMRLLSEQESTLCSTLGVTPAEYISLKAALLKEIVDGDEETTGSSLENNVRLFLRNQGWITA